MNGQYEQLVLALFFLGCLLVLNRSVRNAKKEEQRGSLHLALGLTTLAVVALGNFVATDVVRVSFLRGLDSGVRQIAWFFGIAAGLVLMVSGVSIHFRERSARQAERERQQRLLESFRYLEQLSGVEHRLTTLGQTCLQRVIADTEAQHAALYLVSKVNRSVHLAAAAPLEATDHLSLDDLTVTANAADETSEPVTHPMSLEGFGASTGTPDVVAPMLVHGETVGFLTLWLSDRLAVSADLKRHIQALADMLARHVERQYHREQLAFHEQREQLRDRLHNVCSSAKSFRSVLTELAPLIKSELSCDQITMAIQSRLSGDITLVTLGDSGTPLIEKLAAGSCTDSLRRLIGAGRSVKNPVLVENVVEAPVPFTFGKSRYLAGIEIGANKKATTTAIIGRAVNRPFDPLVSVLLGDVLAVVAETRKAIASRRWTTRQSRRQELLYRFIGSALNDSPEAAIQVGARIIRTETKALSIRLTPFHTDVPVVSIGITEDHPTARAQEVRLPVRIDNRLAAWLMIGRHDTARAISAADRTFVLALASIMFLVARYRHAVRPVVDHSMRSHVRAALGGILGSLELLARPEYTGENSRQRYLGIINRSARRIQTCLDQSDDAVMNHSVAGRES